MKVPHKHSEVIKAWADGAKIEYRLDSGEVWQVSTNPLWVPRFEYRIKPEPKPDRSFVILMTLDTYENSPRYICANETDSNKGLVRNLKLTFDGETCKLKDAKVI